MWFTVCSFLQRGTALITTPIFTRLLTTDEYGLCSIYFAWFEVFVLFTSLKMPYEGLNNGLLRYDKEKDQYTSAVLGLILTMTAAAVPVYWLLRAPLDRLIGLNGFLMTAMLVQLVFNPAMALFTNRERFDFRYRASVMMSLLVTVLNPIISVVMVFATPYHAEARVVSVVAVQSVFGLLCMVILFRRGRVFCRRRYWRYALTFNAPLIFFYLSQFMQIGRAHV